MRKKFALQYFSFFLFTCFSLNINAQGCGGIGQTPSTAFPVCGTNTFIQNVVPICENGRLPGPCSATYPLSDKNPYWYKFKCFVGGTLAFSITPNQLTDDYDWQIFDVTGRNPNAVYNDASLFVACNWSGETGVTGASPRGTGEANCGGTGIPIFNSMSTLIANHDYLLMISHFDNTQIGYSLTFNSQGSASITDPTIPKLMSAEIGCVANQIKVGLNKRLKCNSLTGTGSEFLITPGSNAIANVVGVGCATGFDSDTILVNLSAQLGPGNYKLIVRNGTDGNTILDNCDVPMPPDTINFSVQAVLPTLIDSIAPLKCKETNVVLYFKAGIACNSIAANGSDFVINNGPSTVTVTGATPVCVNGFAKEITLRLANPIYLGGNYRVQLRNGTDGNTILNECSVATPVGTSIGFVTKDTVSAAFTYTEKFSCKADTIQFLHPGRNGVNVWRWTLVNTVFSNVQNPVKIFRDFSTQYSYLYVSNGYCEDSFTVVLTFPNNQLDAKFELSNFVCPLDTAFIVNKSKGVIANYLWDFGNGITSTSSDSLIPLYYTQGTADQFFTVRLRVSNSFGCIDSASQKVKVIFNCLIAVPTAFSPNGDGLNDGLYPLNAYKASNLKFRVFNRFGDMIFETNDWTKRWDGRLDGTPQPTGVYMWTLTYYDAEKKKQYNYRGNTMLVR
jgi:gliding motility-associated-like protein